MEVDFVCAIYIVFIEHVLGSTTNYTPLDNVLQMKLTESVSAASDVGHF